MVTPSYVGGDDYDPIESVPLEIVFSVGDMGIHEQMIAIMEDNYVEGNESFFVNVTSRSNRVTIIGSPAMVTIVDNDGMSTYILEKVTGPLFTECFTLFSQ